MCTCTNTNLEDSSGISGMYFNFSFSLLVSEEVGVLEDGSIALTIQYLHKVRSKRIYNKL